MKIITIVFVILLLILNVNATVEDDFNRIDSTILGTATNGNIWSEISNWEISSNTLYNNGLSSASNTAKIELINSNPTDISYKIYFDGDTDDTFYQRLGDNSGTAASNYAIFISTVSNNLKYYSYNWYDFPTPITPMADTWYTVELKNINYVSNTFDMYFDGVFKGEGDFNGDKDITHVEFDRRNDIGYIDDIQTNSGTTSPSSSGEFVFTGDSLLSYENTYVDADERFSYLIVEALNALSYNLNEVNRGDSSTCVTDDVLCVGRTPFLIDSYTSNVVTANPEYVYLLPNINDLYVGVSSSYYKTKFDEIISDIKVNTQSQIFTSTLVSNDLSGGHSFGTQEESANYNNVLRQVAIENEIPFLELNYLLDHDSSLRRDYTHLNIAGHQAVSNYVVDMVENSNDYIMTENNFNIYHDCDNEISLFDINLRATTLNCADDSTAEWVVIKNIQDDGFTIDRIDKQFYIDFNNRLIPSTEYEVLLDGNLYDEITTDSLGNAENLLFTQTGEVIFNEIIVTPPTEYDFDITNGYVITINKDTIIITDNNIVYTFNIK